MPNTSKPSSSSKGDEASKPVKKRQKSSKTSAKETGSKSSKDPDRCEPPVVSSTKNEVTAEAEGERWYELLKEKIGLDINAKKWMKEHPELASQNKSELLIRLAYELCLAKNTEYDPKKEDEEQNNKYMIFDTKRIFALFEVANDLIEQSDRKNFVKFVCQRGNVQLLKMICKQEEKGVGIIKSVTQYKWGETFIGYSKPIDLLQYVIDNRCSPEIVLCIAEKMYGGAHVLCNGKQYFDSTQISIMERNFDYQDSVVKELLKKAIKLGYKDTVSVMLSGDIYHCIRLMNLEALQANQEFREAYDMIKETVADVISSWVEDKQPCKGSVQNLLDQGIEIDMKDMGKEDLMYQLRCLGKKVTGKSHITKKKLMEELEDLGKEKGEVRLRSSVVGALISTLFFKYQAMKGELFALKTTALEKCQKEKKLKELEWMLQYVKYELARDIVSNEKNSHAAQYLLRELSLSGFADAKFLHAVALLSNELEEIKKEEKVYNLLESASLEHQEAKLLWGILPFRKGYEFVKNNYFDYLREYINVTCDGKDLKKIRLKEKVSIFVAYEYINRYSSYVPYNEQEARNILKKNGYTLELDKLEKIIQEHEVSSKNVLPDVVEILKSVYSIFKQEDSSKLYIQQLLPVLKELYKKLKGSKITIQQSQSLSLVLQQLNSISSPNEKDLLSLQQLCYNLKKEVEKQSSSSFKKEILPLIVKLDGEVFLIMKEQREVNADAQKRRTYSVSFTSTTKPITRRYSTATTVPNRSEGVSNIFTCPSTPSLKVRRFSLARTTSSPELPSVIRAQSTRLDFRTTLPGDGDVSSGCVPFIVKCTYDNLDDPEFMNDIFHLAVDHCGKNEYDKAIPLYHQVFEKREKLLGYENFNTIMVRYNMALALYGLGKPNDALDIFNEMLFKLGKDHYHAQAMKNNMRVILNQEEESCFMQLEEEQEQAARSHFSESASSHFQNTSTVDNGKGSCGSSLSSSSGFDSGLSTFSDRQSISKRGEIAKSGSKLSNLSTRTEQEQSSGSSKQNVSEVTKSNKSSIGEVLCWNESTSESSQSFLRSRSFSGKLSATGMSSSRPSTNLGNLQTEKHTASSRSIGKR